MNRDLIWMSYFRVHVFSGGRLRWIDLTTLPSIVLVTPEVGNWARMLSFNIRQDAIIILNLNDFL